MFLDRIKSYRFHLGLILLVLILYTPLWSGWVYFNYDMVDCWLPWRSFISEHLRQGQLPLWNPWQACGYPIYADLQGPLWSPENFVTGFMFKHATDALVFTFIAYICIGAWGMFDLLCYLKSDRVPAFMGAVLFCCGGFFSSHCQHFYAIISAAWFPYLLLYTFKWLDQKTFKPVATWMLLLFMCTTTGNPSFTIIYFYLFTFLFLHKAYHHYKEKEFSDLKKLGKMIVISIPVLLALHAVLIVSFLQAFEHITRNSGLDVIKAGKEPFTWSCFVSYIFPLTSGTQSDFYGTALPMRNHFMGLFTFPLLLLAGKQLLQGGRNKVLAGFAFFCFLASLGNQTPVFGWVHRFLPLANMFRFPAYYHFFTGTLVIILLFTHWSAIIKLASDKLYKHILVFLIGSVMLAIALYLIVSPTEDSMLYNFRTMLLGHMIALFIYIIIWLWGRWKTQKLAAVLYFLIITDALVMAMGSLIQYYDPGASRIAIKEDLVNAATLHFSNDTLLDNKDQNGWVKTQWRNTNGYLHRVSADYFNSFELKNFVNYTSRDSEGAAQMLNHRLIYALNDSGQASIQNIYVGVNEIKTQVHLSSPTDLVLLQTYFPFWKAIAGTKEVPILQENCFMRIKAPSGNYTLQFEFNPPWVREAAILSYLVFGGLLAFVIIYIKKNG